MRHFGRYTTDIWDDPRFRALTGDAQRVYFMLGLQKDITAAGTLSLRIRRWSRYASDSKPDALSDALSELHEKRFLVVDWETEEVLIRHFVRWDGGINNTKRRPVIFEAAMSVESPSIRATLADELRKLNAPDTVCDALSDTPSDTPAVSQSLSDRNKEALLSTAVKATNHTPGTVNPGPEPRKRGQRITEDWKPTSEDVAWQRADNIPDLLARRELPKFVDHWLAAAGQNASKVDWSRAWRNWLRRAVESSPSKPADNPRAYKAAVTSWTPPAAGAS